MKWTAAFAPAPGGASPALAELSEADWIPVDQVKQRLREAGHTRITASGPTTAAGRVSGLGTA